MMHFSLIVKRLFVVSILGVAALCCSQVLFLMINSSYPLSESWPAGVMGEFAELHGRMPTGWDELDKKGYGRFDCKNGVFILNNNDRPIIVNHHKIAFGMTSSELDIKEDKVVLKATGQPVYLMRTTNDNCLRGDMSRSCERSSRYIYQAMLKSQKATSIPIK